ncbi:hypothetical protein ACLMJK_007438 [Lecanora helva]
MPPESLQSEENNSAEESTPLNNENVDILFKIIKSAEQLPHVNEKPLRAIFDVYETVLHENGLDSAHDQFYLRFLLKLGESKKEGQTLYGRFEALLEALGFEVEFIPDEDQGHVTAQDVDSGEIESAVYAQMQNTRAHRNQHRQSPLASVLGAGDEDTQELPARPQSRASMSRLETTERLRIDVRPSTRATTRKTEKISTYASPSKQLGSEIARGRLKAEEFASSVQSSHENRRVLSNSKDSIKQQRASSGALYNHPNTSANSSVEHSLGEQGVEGKDGFSMADTPHSVESKFIVNRNEQLYNPSRTQLLRDAETFHHYRIRAIAEDVVDRWCYAALQARDRHEHMDRLAAARDAEILLRQVLEHWRVRLHAKKQAVATERYFQQEERRISRTRDLMLLAKAFTHWAQCTFDERQRISNARRKILSMKYFQIWYDITTFNEQSIRQQRLRKFFSIWKKHYVRTLTKSAQAVLVQRDNAIKSAYWHWFWAFCERRAPEWRIGRLQRKYLSQWLIALETNKRRERHIQEQSRYAIQRQIFSNWLSKARVECTNQQTANAINCHNEGTRILQSWRRHCAYAPRYRQISNMVDWRVAGATFATFIARYRYERQAEMVSRLRIMRNAFTQWNDRLRCQTLVHRIDDRYSLEALYRWVISERRVLLQRLLDERLKERFLHKLEETHRARQSQRTQSLLLFQGAQREITLQLHFYCLQNHLAACRQDKLVAFQYHAPKLAQDTIRPWWQLLHKQQKNGSLAEDTDLYYTTRRFMKLWHKALLESKKQKRKNAYVQVRRKQKIRLAGDALRQWQACAAHMQGLERQGESAIQERSLRIGVSLFDLWRDRLHRQHEKNYQAIQHYKKRLTERHLYTWMERLENQAKREDLADLNYDMRVRNVAVSSFNRLRLKIIEFKGQDAKAESLEGWYEKRHCRSFIRQWQDIAAKKVQPDIETARSSRMSRTMTQGVTEEEPTTRAEDWTDFDVGDWVPALEAQASATPVAGYLSTPSKRAARAKALVQVSTTPAGTPFQQRLRSQLGSTPRTGRKGGLGKSASAFKGSTFGAILEDSSRTPDTRNEA